LKLNCQKAWVLKNHFRQINFENENLNFINKNLAVDSQKFAFSGNRIHHNPLPANLTWLATADSSIYGGRKNRRSMPARRLINLAMAANL
jgi:hypothetical protein